MRETARERGKPCEGSEEGDEVEAEEDDDEVEGDEADEAWGFGVEYEDGEALDCCPTTK